jgi:hypothetical protein
MLVGESKKKRSSAITAFLRTTGLRVDVPRVSYVSVLRHRGRLWWSVLVVLKQLSDERKDRGNGLLANEVRKRRERCTHVELIRAAQILCVPSQAMM